MTSSALAIITKCVPPLTV